MKLAALGDSLLALGRRNQSPQDRARGDTSVAAVAATSAYFERVNELLSVYALAELLRIEQRRPPRAPPRAADLGAALAALACERPAEAAPLEPAPAGHVERLIADEESSSE